MARYEREFGGMNAGFGPVRGMDPNYRGGYRGMPFHVEQGQAPYGAYRWRHRQDLGGHGGFTGTYDDAYRRGYDSPMRGHERYEHPRARYDAGLRAYDRGYQDHHWGFGHEQHTPLMGYDQGYPSSGGAREWQGNRDLLRHFNAASPELHRHRGRYDDGGPHRPGRGDHEPSRGLQYHNRGISSGGFSEPWAKGPRGSR